MHRFKTGSFLPVVLAAGPVVSGCAASPEPESTPAAAPSASPTPVDEKSPEEIESERILNLPKPDRFDELEAMTLEEFSLQPIDQRLEYANWLNRDAAHPNQLWNEASGNSRDLMAIDMTVSAENTGDEINANIQSGLRGVMSRHFEEYDLEEVPLCTPLQRQKND